MRTRSAVSTAAAVLGRQGGSVTGPSKARGADHYRAISGRAIRWEHKTEWRHVKIRAGKTGWLVESWSRVSGERTGRRVLIPYGPEVPLRGDDLYTDWNECLSRGLMLAALARDGRALDHGRLVQ